MFISRAKGLKCFNNSSRCSIDFNMEDMSVQLQSTQKLLKSARINLYNSRGLILVFQSQ